MQEEVAAKKSASEFKPLILVSAATADNAIASNKRRESVSTALI
jgi:hypothetical protein